jgi:urate oxidase
MTNAVQLLSQCYGKGRVRVLRVVREPGGIHSVHEVTASIMLQGEFSEPYLSDENRLVVATDTMKNTVHVLAQKFLTDVPEYFALALGDHFLGKFAHVSRVEIELVSTPWERHGLSAGQPHPHAFRASNQGKPFTKVAMTREKAEVASGIRDVLLLKSTASAFKGFPRDEFTTLAETDDRILSTSMTATWTFDSRSADFASANKTIPPTLIDVFAKQFSPSVQNTLYLMGQAALGAVPSITRISIAMPNKHYLPINFQPFGLTNANEIFLPTDEPHGQIEACIGRASS